MHVELASVDEDRVGRGTYDSGVRGTVHAEVRPKCLDELADTQRATVRASLGVVERLRLRWKTRKSAKPDASIRAKAAWEQPSNGGWRT